MVFYSISRARSEFERSNIEKHKPIYGRTIRRLIRRRLGPEAAR